MMISRREFLRTSGAALNLAAAAGLTGSCASRQTAARSATSQPCFLTRGVVLVVKDMETYDWPRLAQEVELTTLATHIQPSEIAAFMKTESGQQFLNGCRERRINVEHELHALSDLLPRSMFHKYPAMFRMNEKGQREGDVNLCVHSTAALELAAENAVLYTRLLPSTTGRYFYWLDDGGPMCRCPECRGFSDSDQALLLENHLLRAIRQVDGRATLAHLAYANTLEAPAQVKPEAGIFLEFAPIQRRYDAPLSRREATMARGNLTHGRLLDALDANLAWFGSTGAQVLEYWLDVSRFSAWNRAQTVEIPWNAAVFHDDLATYAQRGIRHVTTFAAWLDGDYARRWGVAPVRAYGAGMKRWKWVDGKPMQET
jgi:hypothetical protein